MVIEKFGSGLIFYMAIVYIYDLILYISYMVSLSITEYRVIYLLQPK